jgi:hypothetical protein
VPRPFAVLIVCLSVLQLCACSPPASPEQQVRDVIAAGEQAAEQRDLGALMELVSAQYGDESGRDAESLEQYVRGYLMLHPSIHLLTRVEEIDFPYADLARVRVIVGSLGHGAAEGASFEVAAEVEQLEIELVREDEDWRVRRASRL